MKEKFYNKHKLEENNFFKWKNPYPYKKNPKNVVQALLLLIEQMCERAASGKYNITVFADLQGAFDVVWRKGPLYKLYKAGITNNLLPVFSSFLTERFYSNSVDLTPVAGLALPLVFLRYLFLTLLYS